MILSGDPVEAIRAQAETPKIWSRPQLVMGPGKPGVVG